MEHLANDAVLPWLAAAVLGAAVATTACRFRADEASWRWALQASGAVGSAALACSLFLEALQGRRRKAALEGLAGPLASRPEDLARLCVLEGALRRLAASPPHLRESLALRGDTLTRQLAVPAVHGVGGLELLALFPWEGRGCASSSTAAARAKESLQAVLLRSAGDGVHFRLTGTLRHEVLCIAPPGVRLWVPAQFLGKQFMLLVDIAFSGVFRPGVQWLVYQPTLGSNFEMLAVQSEVFFAEKLQGLFAGSAVEMVGRDLLDRWHPKDIHDLYLLSRCGKLDQKKLQEALKAAFCCGGQDLQLAERVLGGELGASAECQRDWRRYRQSAPAPDEVPLHLQDVLRALADFLLPALQSGLERRRGRAAHPASPGASAEALASADAGAAAAAAAPAGAPKTNVKVGLRRALGMRELEPNAEERRIITKMSAACDQRLAQRLEALRPLAPLAYVTSSRRKFEEAQRCLAEWQSMLTMVDNIKPPLTELLPVEELVKAMARYAFSVLRTACFLDIAYLDLEGEPRPLFALGMPEEAFVAQHLGRKGRMRSFLGFCEDGRHVDVFDGALEGQVVEPRGSGPLHNTWDRVWLPDDYPGTLAELETSAFVVSARHLPFLELAQSLRGRDYSQIFEIHVTVQAPDGQLDPVGTFRDACLGLRNSFGAVKPVLIQNASGEAARQMMTASHHVGSLPEVHVLAFRLSQALVQAGYRVERTKIEANMSNSGVPITDEEAARLSPENYFEFHVKLSLPPGFDEERLRVVAAANDARLSRSALRVTEAGVQKRFVTQRLYAVGRISALARFERCCAALQADGFAIESRIREYAVYDSNVRLDRGWIDAPGKVNGSAAAQGLARPSAQLPRTSTANEEGSSVAMPGDAPPLIRDTSSWEQHWEAKRW